MSVKSEAVVASRQKNEGYRFGNPPINNHFWYILTACGFDPNIGFKENERYIQLALYHHSIDRFIVPCLTVTQHPLMYGNFLLPPFCMCQ